LHLLEVSSQGGDFALLGGFLHEISRNRNNVKSSLRFSAGSRWLPPFRPALRLVAAALCFAAGLGNARATVYYADSRSGDDARSGTTPAQAWKSLEKINTKVFQPGDKILLKAGARFAGQLKPQGSGAIINNKTTPIILGKFGRGPRPLIEGRGQVLDSLLLRNVEFWEVEDLEITNLGTNRQPGQTGVRLVSDGFGKMRHIYLRNLFVHDVNGDLRKDFEGCGIFFESRGANNSHFEDLLVENCQVLHTDRNGICQRTRNRSRSLGVVIRGNLLEDIGGDGIKLWGSNGARVERNILRGGRTRCQDYAAGIWPFDCDDAVIQGNEVSGMKGTKDGQGFDSDYLCRRSLFQYNYSHDNDGGFMLICTPGNSYNEDTVIRYNISQNDGINSARVFHFGGGAKNTLVYNNTIYTGAAQNLPLLLFDDWNGGNASGTQFYNNIFYVDGRVTYQWGHSASNTFDSNVFFGMHSQVPPDARALTNRPPLLKPGSGRQGFASLQGYTLRAAPAFPRGRIIPDNGARDFFSQLVPQDRPPAIGASEFIAPAKLFPSASRSR
jgi:hypothetical protein